MSNKFKKIKSIEESLKEHGRKEYEKGVKDAMSVAVNQYNCPDYIRDGVFEVVLKIKPKELDTEYCKECNSSPCKRKDVDIYPEDED